MNRRSVTTLKEFFLVFFGAILGGEVSLFLTDINVFGEFTHIVFLFPILSILLILISWDIYDTPKRLHNDFIATNTHTNTKLILEQLEKVEAQVSHIRKYK